MAKSPQAAIEAGDTLDNLVNQFTDPYACLRELIQNAMDAGSNAVYVEFEFKPYEKNEKGIMIIKVDDTGEGMTRDIIDTKLTRLFSSTKENDLTKIGKFGIGFVSVFALEPDAVFVDTGRDGEYWRLHFKPDRTFDRIILDNPVEGTEIQIIKEVTEDHFHKARQRSIDTITYWCKHTEAEITVDGDPINQKFELTGPYQHRHRAPDTEIVIAPTTESRPYFGFYNRGLTLKEGNEEFIPGVSFKIKSRYLEHTLTRDNVLEDKHYHKAMQMLQEAVDGPFRETLFNQAAKLRDDDLFGYLAYRLTKLPKGLNTLPVLPLTNGKRISIQEFKSKIKRWKEFFWNDGETPLTKALAEEHDMWALDWKGPEEQPGLGRLLEVIRGKYPVLKALDSYALPTVTKFKVKNHAKLLESAARVLHRAGSPYKSIVPASFDENIVDELYVEQDQAGTLLRIDGKKQGFRWPSFLFGKARGKVLLVNVSHELIEPHFRLLDQHPTLASYLLAKAIIIDDGLPAETEAKLIEAALDEEGMLSA